MVQVSPSILAADFSRLAECCTPLVTKQNPLLHFDVMDGVFVGNITVGIPPLRSLSAALPQAWYDVHLMILRPDEYIEEFAAAGAGGITVHIESEGDTQTTLQKIRALGCQAGVTLRPGTPVEALFPLLPHADMVLVMSVEPGFGGQRFLPEALARIAAVRAEATRQKLPMQIEVDGGIDLHTAPACVAAGADILVAGKSVFGAEDPLEMHTRLRHAGERNGL